MYNYSKGSQISHIHFMRAVSNSLLHRTKLNRASSPHVVGPDGGVTDLAWAYSSNTLIYSSIYLTYCPKAKSLTVYCENQTCSKHFLRTTHIQQQYTLHVMLPPSGGLNIRPCWYMLVFEKWIMAIVGRLDFRPADSSSISQSYD